MTHWGNMKRQKKMKAEYKTRQYFILVMVIGRQIVLPNETTDESYESLNFCVTEKQSQFSLLLLSNPIYYLQMIGQMQTFSR